MKESLSLYLLSILFFCCIGFSISCASESSNPFGLKENKISYTLSRGTERTYTSNASLIEDNGKYTLKIKGAIKSDGIIITIKNVEPFKPKKYIFYKDVSIILNDKTGDELMIYVSTGCKENKGIFEIVEWNKNTSTISGVFSGPVCTRGIFAHLPSTVIEEGSFYKIKYNDEQ